MEGIRQKALKIKDRIDDLVYAGHGPKLVAGAVALVLFIGLIAYALLSSRGGTQPIDERIHSVEAKRAVSGHYVKLKDDLKLVYLGVRSPWEGEPFYEESKARNEQLVAGKELRLRYDGEETDKEGRLNAYVFLDDDMFVNEVLISEGLAYARLYPQVQRFRDRLLAAQNKARRNHAGIWSTPLPKPAEKYLADPKYAEFHRPDCEIALQIKPERLATYSTRNEAFSNGMQPCNKCNP